MPNTPSPPNTRNQRLLGRIFSTLGVLMLVLSAVGKLSHGEQVVATFQALGFSPDLLVPLGVIELLCAAMFVSRPLAIYGVAFATAYMGGAVAAHVRVGEGFFPPMMVATLLWLGLFFRSPRLRALAAVR